MISNCDPCRTRIDAVGHCDLGAIGCGDSACACQHGHPLEVSPFAGDDQLHSYVDALPPDDPRRTSYEAKVRRSIDGNRLPGPNGAMDA